MKRWIIAAALLLTALPALAQDVPEDEEPSQDPVVVTTKRDMNLRSSPGGPKKGTLKRGIEVEVVGTSEGWMRVRDGSRVGWVERRYLSSNDPEIRMEASFTRKPQKESNCGVTDLKDCKLEGCASTEDHELMNRLKHGPGSGTPARLTIASFETLQKLANTKFGEGSDLDSGERESIRKLKVGNVTVGEGHLVTITGYFVGDPHPNDHETVNCNLKGAENNDMHIPFADSPDKTPFEGIVIETIPQARNAGWTRDKMKQVEKKRQLVMVTGQLFYDNEHRVRKNDNNPKLSHQPQRFSLWEVHPVNELLVCTNPPCSPAKKSQWTKLEDLE